VDFDGVRRKRKKNLEVVLLFEGSVHEACLLAIWNQRFATHFGKEDFSAAAKPVEFLCNLITLLSPVVLIQ
jgi:hypothetical protein